MYTLDGKPIQMLGRHGVHSDTGCERPGDLVPRAAGPFNYPSEMVPAPSGDLYVSDGYRNARVHRFATWDGQLKKSWGEPGKTAPGHFHLPHSLIVANDKVYVCDRENHRLQVFSLDGESLDIWTDIQRPMDISIDHDGVFYVSEGSVNEVFGTCQRAGLGRKGPGAVSLPGTGPRQLGRFSWGYLCWVEQSGRDRQVRTPGVNPGISRTTEEPNLFKREKSHARRQDCRAKRRTDG